MLYTDFRDGNFIERENELTKVHKDYFLLTAIFFFWNNLSYTVYNLPRYNYLENNCFEETLT